MSIPKPSHSTTDKAIIGLTAEPCQKSAATTAICRKSTDSHAKALIATPKFSTIKPQHTKNAGFPTRRDPKKSALFALSPEAEIAQLSPPEQKDLPESLGVGEPGLHRLIREAFALLRLRTYFTAGPKELHAWTIHEGTKAPQAAGVIHSDFERGFIRAETYNCEDIFALNSEVAVKEAGKYRSEGKDYVVQDGNLLVFATVSRTHFTTPSASIGIFFTFFSKKIRDPFNLGIFQFRN